MKMTNNKNDKPLAIDLSFEETMKRIAQVEKEKVDKNINQAGDRKKKRSLNKKRGQ